MDFEREIQFCCSRQDIEKETNARGLRGKKLHSEMELDYKYLFEKFYYRQTFDEN
jgi:hypothetical protein